MTMREMTNLVQRSFALVEIDADAVSRTFYRRLFEARPSVRMLFPEELEEQRVKLMKSLALIVNNLADLERVRPHIEALGRRHLAYGVKNQHYAVVGESLLGALAERLGEDFTDEVRAAWTEVYGLLADTMKEAATRAESEEADMAPASYLPGGSEQSRQRALDTWMVSATRYRTFS